MYHITSIIKYTAYCYHHYRNFFSISLLRWRKTFLTLTRSFYCWNKIFFMLLWRHSLVPLCTNFLTRNFACHNIITFILFYGNLLIIAKNQRLIKSRNVFHYNVMNEYIVIIRQKSSQCLQRCCSLDQSYNMTDVDMWLHGFMCYGCELLSYCFVHPCLLSKSKKTSFKFTPTFVMM